RRLLAVAQLPEDLRQQKLRLQGARIQARRLLHFRPRLAQPLLPQQGHGQAVADHPVARRQASGLEQLRLCLRSHVRPLLAGEIEASEREVVGRRVRRLLNGALHRGEAQALVSGREGRHAQPVISGVVARLLPQILLQRGDRALEVAPLNLEDAEPQPRGSVIGPDAEQPLEGRYGAAGILLKDLEQAAQIERCGEVRLQAQRPVQLAAGVRVPLLQEAAPRQLGRNPGVRRVILRPEAQFGDGGALQIETGEKPLPAEAESQRPQREAEQADKEDRAPSAGWGTRPRPAALRPGGRLPAGMDARLRERLGAGSPWLRQHGLALSLRSIVRLPPPIPLFFPAGLTAGQAGVERGCWQIALVAANSVSYYS